MQKILLARGKVALVDDRDYGYLMQWKWYAHKSYDAFYVRRNIPVNGKEKDKRMHRIIMCVPKGMFVDHINHNTLDNRRENLRICTQSQNSHNAVLSTRNSSGYKGVSWRKDNRKWQAGIVINRIRKHLGYFKDINDAVVARKIAEKKYVGEFAFNN